MLPRDFYLSGDRRFLLTNQTAWFQFGQPEIAPNGFKLGLLSFITVICHTTPHPKFQTEHHGNDGIEHQYIMYIIQLFSETMGCTHGLYNCNYLLYVCSVTMLVMPSVACTVSRATHSPCHWSCCLLGVLLVGHPLPALLVAL